MTVEDVGRDADASTAIDTMAAEPEFGVNDFGAAAVDLETLRILLAQYCPAVLCDRITVSSIRHTEYRFVLPPSREHSYRRMVTVQAPVTRTGRQRDGWRFRLGGRQKGPWQITQDMQIVIDWICKQAEWT